MTQLRLSNRWRVDRQLEGTVADVYDLQYDAANQELITMPSLTTSQTQ